MKTERNDIVTFLFWSNLAAFVLHVMDETLMAGGFVSFIQQHYWSGFAMADFFTANAVWLTLIGLSNITYDVFGKRLAVIPLVFLWERVFNALFHLGSCWYYREYSPGLVSGVLFFVILYLVCRFGILRGHIRRRAFIVSALAALLFESVFISSMWWAH